MRRLYLYFIVVVLFARVNFAALSIYPVANLLLKLLNDKINGYITTGSAKLIFPSTLEFTDAMLADKNSKPIISVKKISVTIDLVALLKGDIIISSGTAIEPYFYLSILNHHVNIADAFKKSTNHSNPSNPKYRIENITVERGRFEMETNVGVQIFSGEISIAASVIGTPNGVLVEATSVRTSSGTIGVPGMEFPYRGLIAHNVVVTPNWMSVNDLTTHILGSELYVDGQLDFLSSEYDLAGTLDAPHGTWPIGLAPPPFSMPKLNTEFSIFGIFENPLININAEFGAAEPFGIKIAQGTASGLVTKAKVAIKHAFVDIAGKKSVSATGSVARAADSWNSIDIVAKGRVKGFGVEQYKPNVDYEVSGNYEKANGLFLKSNLQSKDIRVSGLISVKDSNLELEKFTGAAFGGALAAAAHVNLSSFNSKTIDAEVTAKNDKFGHIEAALSVHQLNVERLPLKRLSGNADLSVMINGSTKQPNIYIQTRSNNLAIADINLGQFSAQTHIDGKQHLSGDISLKQTDLSASTTFSSLQLEGKARGTAKIAGTLTSPNVKGEIFFSGLTLAGKDIGTGATKFNLEGPNHLLQIAGIVEKQQEKILLSAAYLPTNNELNAQVKIEQISIYRWTTPMSTVLMPMTGFLSGEISITGYLPSPKLSASIDIPMLQFGQENVALSNSKGEQAIDFVPVGKVEAQVSLERGRLQGILCGLPHDFLQIGCGPKDRISIKAAGAFSSLKKYDLKLEGNVNYQGLEQIIRALNKELANVNTEFLFTVNAARANKDNPKLQGSLDIQTLQLKFPGIPRAQLEKPVKISFGTGKVAFDSEATFEMKDGKFSIGGYAQRNRQELTLNGQIPLILTKYLTPYVSGANGTVDGHLTLLGSYDNPKPKGFASPNRGASITFRKFVDPIEFTSGQVTFESSMSEDQLVFSADKLQMTIGEGRAQIDGNVKFINKSPNEWHVSLTGSNILLRSQESFIEGGFRMKLDTISNEHWLTGLLEINDGKYQKNFTLRNFILSSIEPTSNSPIVYPKWLSPLNLNIDLIVHALNARSSMIAFTFDANFMAELSLQGSLQEPRLFGELELTQGTLTFPAVNFEIPSTVIPLRKNSSLFIDPKIDLAATADLSPARFNVSVPTTIQLSLKGNSLNTLYINLESISGDKTLTPGTIFVMLLSPSSSQTSSDGVKQAAVLLPAVSDELQNLFGTGNTGNLYIGSSLQKQGIATRLKWQLDPRLEIEGTAAATTDYPVQDLTLRFVLFDHLPVGKKLFFESVFFSPVELTTGILQTNRLELKYRVLEQ